MQRVNVGMQLGGFIGALPGALRRWIDPSRVFARAALVGERRAWWGYIGVGASKCARACWRRANGMRRMDENMRSSGYYQAKGVVEELDRD